MQQKARYQVKSLKWPPGLSHNPRPSNGKPRVGLQNSFVSHLSSHPDKLDPRPVISLDRLGHFSQTSFSYLDKLPPIDHESTLPSSWHDVERAKGEDHIHDGVLRPLRVHVPLPIQEARPCPWWHRSLWFSYPSLISKDLEPTFPCFHSHRRKHPNLES